VLYTGRLSVALYPYNDLLLRVRDASGALLPSMPQETWTAILAASNVQPLYLQLNGAPAHLDTLFTPSHRVHFYGDASRAYQPLHLGGDRPMTALHRRPSLSTQALYAPPAGPRPSDNPPAAEHTPPRSTSPARSPPAAAAADHPSSPGGRGGSSDCVDSAEPAQADPAQAEPAAEPSSARDEGEVMRTVRFLVPRTAVARAAALGEAGRERISISC